MDRMHPFFVQMQLDIPGAFLQLFASLLLGLAWMLVVWHSRVRGQISTDFRIWLRVFALTAYAAMALGFLVLMVSVLVLPLAIERTGSVLGPWMLLILLLAYGIKSTTFGVVLYGRHRVRPAFFRFCLMVTALGVTAIVLALSVIQSWMRAPAGATFLDGQFRIHDWMETALNPQLPLQLLLVVASALILLAAGLQAMQARQIQLRTTIHKGASGRMVLSLVLGLLGLFAWLPYLLVAQTGEWSVLAHPQDFLGQLSRYEADEIPFGWQTSMALWLLQLLMVCFGAWSLHRARQSGRSRVLRAALLAPWTAALLTGSGWWLLQQAGQQDAIVGLLRRDDLLSVSSAPGLWGGTLLCLAVVVVVVFGWGRLVSLASRGDLVVVHRPGMKFS